MDLTTLKKPSAWLPVGMSLAAMAVVGIHVAIYGPAPEPDEGTAAHLWQMLMAFQAPIVLFFALRWVPRRPRHGLPILAVQLGAALAAMAPVYLLKL